jgi:predicted MFS family arabinose efflux permease
MRGRREGQRAEKSIAAPDRAPQRQALRCRPVTSRAPLLAALTVGWAVVWVQRAVVGPVGPLLRASLGLDYAQLGLLPSLGLLGGAVGYFAAGRAAAGHPRGTLLGGALLLALASLAAAGARDYPSLAAALIAQGIGEGLFYVPALALVARAYAGAGGGRALGLLDSGISVGSVLAFAAAPFVAAPSGWQGPFLFAGALGLLALVLLALAVPRLPAEAAPPLRDVLERRAAPVYAALVLLIVSYFAVLYLAPAFLATRGFPLAQADLLAALAVVLGIPWHVLGGHFADKHGPARTAAGFALAQGLCTIALALPLGPLPTTLLLIATYSLGIAAFVALMTLVPHVFGAALAGPAFGVFWTVGYVGGAAGPLLLGGIADRAGFGPALALLGLFALGCAVVVWPLRRAASAS